MKSPYELFETDAEVEKEKGIDIDYGSFQITILRAGGANKKYANVLNAKIQPVRRRMQNGSLSDDESSKIYAEVYADSIITGWKGVKDRKGKAIPYTRENVIKLLLDLPELFRDIEARANSFANFRKEDMEEDAKNSKKS